MKKAVILSFCLAVSFGFAHISTAADTTSTGNSYSFGQAADKDAAKAARDAAKVKDNTTTGDGNSYSFGQATDKDAAKAARDAAKGTTDGNAQ